MSDQHSHDIFISFSFVDQCIAEEIVNVLTSRYGFSCWICTREIAGGNRYKALIPRAIDESRAVVFIQSENALESREIPKEIGLAFEADKPIIPFKIDQSQPQGDLRYDLYGVQFIDGTVPTREQRIYELAKAISKAIGKPLFNSPALSNSLPVAERLVSTPSVIPKSIFYGRDNVIKKISQKFENGERVVFLQGIGGIGKTEIAKQYIECSKRKYDTVIFATYSGSLVNLINGEIPFEIEPAFIRDVTANGIQEDDLSFFKRKLHEIQKLSNERTLIVVDNFDVAYDDALPELLNGRYHLLITTRCDYSRTYPCVKIEAIDSMDDLVHIFMQNYQGFEVDENDPDLIDLIELVDRHTYTIELLAQHMENSGQTAREMIDALKHEGILSLSEEIYNAGNKTQIAYVNLLRMFKVFDLSEQEKELLRYLSLMPLSGVTVHDFKVWAKLHSLKVLIDLERRGWTLRKADGIALHPIIRDVIRHELPANEKNCAEFLANFVVTIAEEKSWHYSLAEKEKYANIAASILECFPNINNGTIALYQAVEILYSFSVRPVAAAKLAEQIYHYYEGTLGKYSFKSGRAAFKAGWLFAFNLWLDNALSLAETWLELAADILGKIQLCSVEEHFEYSHTLVNLAKISLLAREALKDDSYLDKARQYATAAVQDEEKWIPKDDPHYSAAGAYMQLSEVYIAMENYEEALKFNDKAYNILYARFGPDDPDTMHYQELKVKILYGMQRFDEAIKLSDIIAEKYDLFYSKANANRYRCNQLILKLKCLLKLNRSTEAKEVFNELIKLAKSVFSSDEKQLREINQLAEVIYGKPAFSCNGNIVAPY